MENITNKELYTDIELILNYLYGTLDQFLEQRIDDVIAEDEGLSIFYEDLMMHILKTGAQKNDMRKYLTEMLQGKGRFNSSLSNLKKFNDSVSNLLK